MGKGASRALEHAASKGRVLAPQVIPFDLEIAVVDPDDAVAFASAVIGGLPQGNILLVGALMYAQFTDVGGDGLIAAFAGDFSVGTAATADADVSDAGEQNIIRSTELLASSGATPRIRALMTNTSDVLASPLMIDNTDGSAELNLNLLIDNESIDDDAVVRAQGELYLAYMVMGDD